MSRKRGDLQNSGGARHHRQARREAGQAISITKHNRKYRRAVKMGLVKDGFDIKDENVVQVKQVPKRMEDRRPPQELDGLEIRGKKDSNKSVYEHIMAFFEVKRDPKVLITTAKKPSRQTATFAAHHLSDLFPCSEYHARKDFAIKTIAQEAREHGYTHILVLGQETRKKEPDALVVILLGSDDSQSVTTYFRLTSIKATHKQIQNKAKSTPHFPELILNHFTTELGMAIGHLFISLFPVKPEFRGRQVVTMHNQRDFIFVRRHRYIFEDLPESKRECFGDADGLNRHARVQEIGPQFTMKLEAVQGGIFEPHHAIMTSQSASMSHSTTDSCPSVITKSETAQAARFKKFIL